MYSMLRRHIVLLIAIRPSDGDLKLGGPLSACRVEQAMSRHGFHILPSFHHHHHHHTHTHTHTHTQLPYTNSYTYSHPNLNFLQYTIQILIPHVMWSAQVVRRPHSTPFIRLARNPKRVRPVKLFSERCIM